MASPQIPSLEEISQERRRIARKQRFRQILGSTVGILIVVAAAAAILATLFLPVLRVSGDSMSPALEDGDILLLWKTDRLKTGDLIGFSWQNKLLLKRVVAFPGDVVSMDAQGNVSVNGELLEEPYVDEKALGECSIEFPYQVPESHYFVLGDHRATSIDSRSTVIGCVAQEQVIGKVLLKIWPLAIQWTDILPR